MAQVEAKRSERLSPPDIGKLALGEIEKLDEELATVPGFTQALAREWFQSGSDTQSNATTSSDSPSDSINYFQEGREFYVTRRKKKDQRGRWTIERRVTVQPVVEEGLIGGIILISVFLQKKGVKRFKKGSIIVLNAKGINRNSHAAVEKIPSVLSLLK